MKQRDTVRTLLKTSGSTYAHEVGITLTNKPSPLYRLLVLSVLLSTRIKAEIAMAAARELADYSTPERMRDASWQDRVDALGRGHYVRYDESTATALGQGAQQLIDDYRGDLRQLRERANGDPTAIREHLTETPRLGPVGADIFCREAQLVWPELRPYFDKKSLSGAHQLGLPTDPEKLARLVDDSDDLAPLAAALVRATLHSEVRDTVAHAS